MLKAKGNVFQKRSNRKQLFFFFFAPSYELRVHAAQDIAAVDCSVYFEQQRTDPWVTLLSGGSAFNPIMAYKLGFSTALSQVSGQKLQED